MTDADMWKLWAQAGSVFTPGAPIDQFTLFAGRTDRVREVVNAVNQRGQHVILFGERGVGKTSLANVLAQLMASAGIQGVKSGTVNCDGTDDFASLWRKVFREMHAQRRGDIKIGLQHPEADTETFSLDRLLPEKVTPDDVRHLVESLGKRVVIVIDELDRIQDTRTTELLADTIKNLSDHSSDCTLVLVGVADSVDELIRQHQSIERALVQVQMPRMSLSELLEILQKGLAELGVTMADDVKLEIAELSQGLPHFTHLLALHSCQAAIEEKSTHVGETHLTAAIGKAVSKAQQSILSAYHKATASPRKDNLYAKVLLACALARTDDLGYFAAADVRDPMSKIAGRRYEIPAFSQHLNDFCETKKGNILHKTGSTRRFRFRFSNPMLQPYVVMHGRASGLLPKEYISADPSTAKETS